MNSFSHLPTSNELQRISFHALLVLLRSLFLDAAQKQHGEAREGAPIALGEMDSKARQHVYAAINSLEERGLAFAETHRGFAYVTLTDSGRANAVAMAQIMFGAEWAELDLGRYLYATFKRCECASCGVIFYTRRKRKTCSAECKRDHHNARVRKERRDDKRKRADVTDPVAADFDARRDDELSDFAASIFDAELLPPPCYELTCEECGKAFVSPHSNALYCGRQCRTIARREAERIRCLRKAARERELANV